MSKRTFTTEQVALIHRTMMEGASKDDVALFVATCERTGLDPFARQIMPSSRNTQKNGSWVTLWTWLVTIDGLRKIAVDSGDYEGQEGPWWCGPDGVWKEIWTDPKNPCFAAKVLVHRKGFRQGLSGIAKYGSYVQKKKDGTPNQVWSTLGDHMTAKCAEALALRRAYPNEMAGLYTADEMAQAGFEMPEDPKQHPSSTPQQPAQAPAAQPAADDEPRQWPVEDQEQFAMLMDEMYVAFKDAGKLDKHSAEAEKWRKRMATDTPDSVLPALNAFVVKLKEAAEKIKSTSPKAA